MRVATWNMKQAVAPKKPLDELWMWLENSVAPDVAILTEAKVPKDGFPVGWQGVWEPDGIGPRRRWGTVVAGRGVDVTPVGSVTVGRLRKRTVELTSRHPAAAIVADVSINGEWWATVVGLYGLTMDRRGKSCGHGRYMTPALLRDLSPLFESDRRDRIIVAGDFNLWPRDMPRIVDSLGLFDLIEVTADTRPPLDRCSGCTARRPDECGHLWTHRNGNSPNAAQQQIDFILATNDLAHELDTLTGGIRDYPDAWAVSDHAPVVAEFRG
jgi:endonuclease/exonuclease/phosphatase (EEP) superfamily protein YafD